MLKNKVPSAHSLFIFAFAFCMASPLSAQQAPRALEDQGKNTCGFTNTGQVRWGRSQDLRTQSEFCHATVLSRTKVLVSHPDCWNNKRFPLSQQRRLSCYGDRQVYQLPQTSESRQLSSGQQIVHLPEPLPYSPHQLARDPEKKEQWLLDQPQDCQIESPYQTRPLAQFEVSTSENSPTRILDESESGIFEHGAHITCQDTQGERFIVAQIKKDGTLWPELKDSWPSDFFEETQTPLYRELDQLERLRLLCQENGECLEALAPQARQLSEDFLPIIQKMSEDYQNQELKTSYQELQRQLEELLLECQDVAWQIQRAQDDSAVGGFGSGVMGNLEAFSLNVAEKFNQDFLVNQFMGMEMIASEFSRREVQEIVRETEQIADEQDLGTIARVAQTALQLSRRIVVDMLLEMNPDLTEAQQAQLWEEVSRDFQSCLERANNVDMIKECSDKFSLTAPTVVADIELQRQIEINFKQRNNEQDFEELKLQSQLAYRRCLQNYYYPQKENPELTHSDRIRACVYEGILSGYKSTARSQIAEGLENVTQDPDVIEQAQLSSLERAQNCDYGAIFHRQEQRTERDYDSLARLSTDDFQKALEDCSKNLTRAAGEHVIRESVLRTPEVLANFSPEQRRELSDRVLQEYYTPCLEAQEEPDPTRCEGMIKDLTTLQVATPMMIEAVDEQMAQLITEGDGQTDDAAAGEIKDEVRQSMNACHERLKDQHLQTLQQQSQEQGNELDVLDCLEQGIRLVARGSAQQVLENGIQSNPQTREFAQEILSQDEVQQLPEQTAQCFGERVQALERAEDLSGALSEISRDCALRTQKQATILSLQPIIDEKLKSNIPNDEQRESFIQETLEGENGLRTQIESAENQEELDAILNEVPSQVALRFARQSVPELVERYLREMAPPDKREEISQEIVGSLEQCLQDSQKTQEQFDICINQTTTLGHLVLLEEIVEFNALKSLQNDTETAERLVADSQERLKNCLEQIPSTLDSEEFNQRLEPCITHEIGLISRDIPREAILSIAPLMKTDYDEAQLREQMQKIEQFYLSEGNLDGVDDHDPALTVYMSLNTCITSARSDIRRAQSGVDEAQRMYEQCTSRVEDSIKASIKRGFVGGNYEGQKRSHFSALDTAGDILLGLTGNSPSTSNNETSSENPHQETLELLELVGQNTVIACNYAPQRCERELELTQREIQRYKREHPNATSEEIQAEFINSSFMKLVIEANIAQTLQKELKSSLSQFQDEEGTLEGQIESITSPAVMGPIMNNRYGQAVSQLVSRAIQEGEIESVVNDPTTRSALGLALVENTEDGSFSDRLLFGLVQPQLHQQRTSSSGVGGIFKNTKVAFGRLFGVVRGRDFDWNRIRSTPQGRQAREIFARDILLPVLQGEDLSTRASNGSQKSIQDRNMERIQALIEEGIKDLSQ